MRIARLLVILAILNQGCGSDPASGTGDVSAPSDSASATDVVVTTTPTDAATADPTDAVTSTATDTDSATDTGAATDTGVATDSSGDSDEPDISIAPQCTDGDDCTLCPYATAPNVTDDCYCVSCPSTVMSKTQCDVNAALWESTCGGDKWQDTAGCGIPRCISQPEPTCADDVCVAGVAPSTCGTDDDCQRCAFDKPVTSADDCYCLFCGSPLDKTTCAANQAGWQQFCNPWPKETPCPAASCIYPGAPICDDSGTCADHPDGCTFDEGCTTCPYTNVPKSPDECACSLCPVAHSQQFCADVEEANATVCADFDFSACLLPPCAFPPEASCGDDQRCILDAREP